MSFDQGELDFSQPTGSGEAGYRNWHAELDARKRAFERRWGIVLGRPVRVQLENYDSPIEGVIHLRAVPNRPGPARPPVLCVGRVEFTPADIESIVQTSGGSV